MAKKASESIREAVTPKKRGRKPLPKPIIDFKDGLRDIGIVETVSLEDIDVEDQRFQYRVAEKGKDMIPSLIKEGQLVPVILWGDSKPLKIIDGFRRTQAIKQIGWGEVKAIIYRSISEEDAYRLSFVENFKRKNFSPIDIAHAIWKAQSRGKSNEELQAEFHLSERQLFRYKAMVEFSDAIKAALSGGIITMAHAQVFHAFNIKDLEPWIEKITNAGLTAKDMKKALTRESDKKTKPRKYFKKEKDGFRLYPIRFSYGAPAKYRNEIRKVLENALAMVNQEAEKEGEGS